MNLKKHLLSRGHTILFAGGCVLACGGIYLWSQQAEAALTWKAIAAHVMTVLGFLAAMIGVFWSICRSMRSKLYQSRRRQLQLQRHLHVHTIHRPSSFPPSYEESQCSQQVRPDASTEVVVLVDGLDVVVTLAPPLYSQDGLQAPDCRWSWELPPPYSQVESGGRLVEVEEEEERDGG